MANNTKKQQGPGGKPGFGKPKNAGKTIKRLLSYVAKSKGLLVVVIFLVLFSAFANIAGTYFLTPIINEIAKLVETGAKITQYDEAVRVQMNSRPKKCNIKTMPHPGFPTDMQPQIATLLAVAEGTSIITEGVWDNRFRYVEQLTLMGADIQVDGKMAVITGVKSLSPAPVKAVDLRAGAAMVIAGLMAKGQTVIENIEFIDRGYDSICEKLAALGADIKRVDFGPEIKILKQA